ncbi:hypothetical protein AB0C76_04690 [Kitasatospora sp. NPDC048722]
MCQAGRSTAASRCREGGDSTVSVDSVRHSVPHELVEETARGPGLP